MNSSQILSIITAYNNDPRSFTDKDVELIAMLSKMSGISMRRDVHMKPKPFQKLGFNLADVGMAGMLPDEWEPMSEGEPYFGETKGEKAAGNVGSLLGIAAGIGSVAGVGYAILLVDLGFLICQVKLPSQDDYHKCLKIQIIYLIY